MMKAFPLHLCVVLFGCVWFRIQSLASVDTAEAFVTSQKSTDLPYRVRSSLV